MGGAPGSPGRQDIRTSPGLVSVRRSGLLWSGMSGLYEAERRFCRRNKATGIDCGALPHGISLALSESELPNIALSLDMQLLVSLFN